MNLDFLEHFLMGWLLMQLLFFLYMQSWCTSLHIFPVLFPANSLKLVSLAKLPLIMQAAWSMPSVPGCLSSFLGAIWLFFFLLAHLFCYVGFPSWHCQKSRWWFNRGEQSLALGGKTRKGDSWTGNSLHFYQSLDWKICRKILVGRKV